MKIKKGDTVLITKGKDRGRRGKVLRVFPKEKRILVEGLNLKKRHIRPKRTGEKGEIVTTPEPISVANVKLICPSCKKATRVGYRIKSKIKKAPLSGARRRKLKVRICKKCGKPIK